MKTSIIKSIFVALFFVSALFLPPSGIEPLKSTLLLSFLALVIGVIIPTLLVYNSLHNKLSLSKPNWNDKILTKNPLISIQFVSAVLFFYGAGAIITSAVIYQQLSLIGSIVSALGIGMILGIKIIYKKITKITE